MFLVSLLTRFILILILKKKKELINKWEWVKE